MTRRPLSFVSMVIAVLAAMISIAPALAQEATPVAQETPATAADQLRPWIVEQPFTPPPDECTASPVDLAQITTSMATPIPVPGDNLTSHDIHSLTVTGLADAATVAGVLDTLSLFWACTNAGNRPAVASLMTLGAIAQFYNIDLTLSGTDLDDEIANRLANSGDRDEADWASIDGVLTIEYLGDGRTGALVLNTDPFVNNGNQVLDLFIFANLNGVFQVDSVVLDPFDLTPGYGYEKGE